MRLQLTKVFDCQLIFLLLLLVLFKYSFSISDELRKANAEEDITKNLDTDINDASLRGHDMLKKNPVDITYVANLFDNEPSKATFDCVSEGLPLLEIEWRRLPSNQAMKSVNIKRDSKKIVNNLVFEKISRKDQGVYICKLKDKHVIVKKLNLIVRSKSNEIFSHSTTTTAFIKF